MEGDPPHLLEHLASVSGPLKPLLADERIHVCPWTSASPVRGYRRTLACWATRGCLPSCSECSLQQGPGPQTPLCIGAETAEGESDTVEDKCGFCRRGSVAQPIGALKVLLPCFVVPEAETHAEEDAYEPQTHSDNDACHRVDVQLWKQSQTTQHERDSCNQFMIHATIHATNKRNTEIPEEKRFPNMISCQLLSKHTCVCNYLLEFRCIFQATVNPVCVYIRLYKALKIVISSYYSHY